MDAQTPEAIKGVLLFMVAVFISILIHELGHALTGLKMGAPRTSIELHGMGGLARFPNARFNRKQSILTTAAGPGASLFLAFFAHALIGVLSQNMSDSEIHNSPVVEFLLIVKRINIFWSIVNLFPVLPLDGGQILRDLLGPRHYKLTATISLVTLVILAALLWLLTQSIFNMVIMALLAQQNWAVYKANQQNPPAV